MTDEPVTRNRIWRAPFVIPYDARPEDPIKIDEYIVTQQREIMGYRGSPIIMETRGRETTVLLESLPVSIQRHIRETPPLEYMRISRKVPVDFIPGQVLEDAEVIIEYTYQYQGQYEVISHVLVTHWREISRRLRDRQGAGNEPRISRDSNGVKTDPALYADIVAEVKKKDESRDNGIGGGDPTGESPA